jgi:hypothetical protein
MANGQPPFRVAVHDDSSAQIHDPSGVGEVQARELAKQLDRSFVVCPGRFDLIHEKAKVMPLTTAVDSHLPFPASLIPADPLETRCAAMPPLIS